MRRQRPQIQKKKKKRADGATQLYLQLLRQSEWLFSWLQTEGINFRLLKVECRIFVKLKDKIIIIRFSGHTAFSPVAVEMCNLGENMEVFFCCCFFSPLMICFRFRNWNCFCYFSVAVHSHFLLGQWWLNHKSHFTGSLDFVISANVISISSPFSLLFLPRTALNSTNCAVILVLCFASETKYGIRCNWMFIHFVLFFVNVLLPFFFSQWWTGKVSQWKKESMAVNIWSIYYFPINWLHLWLLFVSSLSFWALLFPSEPIWKWSLLTANSQVKMLITCLLCVSCISKSTATRLLREQGGSFTECIWSSGVSLSIWFRARKAKQSKIKKKKKCCFCLHLQGAKMLPQWLKFSPGKWGANICKFCLCLTSISLLCRSQMSALVGVLLQGSSHWVFFFLLTCNCKGATFMISAKILGWRFWKKWMRVEWQLAKTIEWLTVKQSVM